MPICFLCGAYYASSSDLARIKVPDVTSSNLNPVECNKAKFSERGVVLSVCFSCLDYSMYFFPSDLSYSDEATRGFTDYGMTVIKQRILANIGYQLDCLKMVNQSLVGGDPNAAITNSVSDVLSIVDVGLRKMELPRQAGRRIITIGGEDDGN